MASLSSPLRPALSSFTPAQGKDGKTLLLPAVLPGQPISTRPMRSISCSSRSTSPSPPSKEAVLRAFREKRAFKVIAGLQNFNLENVRNVVAAAQAGGASLVDIACDPDLVRLALSVTSLPVCVSAVDPEAFFPSVAAGAHMLEIGNFDSFYSSGRTFSAQEVLELTRRTRSLFPGLALSVTVPHTLALSEQAELAEALQAAGADIIQTEGGTSAAPSSTGILGLVQKATPALAAAHAISRAVDIPVMCASGLSSVTVPLALAAGASGVGVGSAINKLQSPIEMVAVVRSISDALENHRASRVGVLA